MGSRPCRSIGDDLEELAETVVNQGRTLGMAGGDGRRSWRRSRPHGRPSCASQLELDHSALDLADRPANHRVKALDAYGPAAPASTSRR